MEKYGHGQYILELSFSEDGVFNYATDAYDRSLDILKPFLEDHLMFSDFEESDDEDGVHAELVIEFSVHYYKTPATYYDPPEEGSEAELDRAYLVVDGVEIKLPDDIAQTVYDLKQEDLSDVRIDWTDASDMYDDRRDYMESLDNHLDSINELLLPSPDHLSRFIDDL